MSCASGTSGSTITRPASLELHGSCAIRSLAPHRAFRLELLAKLNREIGSRADEAPGVRIVIGGNIPLEGMRAVTPTALPPTDPDAIPDP